MACVMHMSRVSRTEGTQFLKSAQYESWCEHVNLIILAQRNVHSVNCCEHHEFLYPKRVKKILEMSFDVISLMAL